jgi:hypothetical protein
VGWMNKNLRAGQISRPHLYGPIIIPKYQSLNKKFFHTQMTRLPESHKFANRSFMQLAHRKENGSVYVYLCPVLPSKVEFFLVISCFRVLKPIPSSVFSVRIGNSFELER